MYLFFDTETTGLPDDTYPLNDVRHWPRMVQLGWLLFDEHENELKRECHIVKPEGYTIPEGAVKIHGITTDRALNEGISLGTVLNNFSSVITQAQNVLGHNVGFDIRVIDAEYQRMKLTHGIHEKQVFCTMKHPTIIDFCKLPNPNYPDSYKWPKLPELHIKIFEQGFEEAHDALIDAEACARCYFELKRRGIV
jgi:DNA polymerase III subunit epsilon